MKKLIFLLLTCLPLFAAEQRGVSYNPATSLVTQTNLSATFSNLTARGTLNVPLGGAHIFNQITNDSLQPRQIVIAGPRSELGSAGFGNNGDVMTSSGPGVAPGWLPPSGLNNWKNSGTTNSTLAGVGSAWSLLATNSVTVGADGEQGVLDLYSTNGTHIVTFKPASDGTLNLQIDGTEVLTVDPNGFATLSGSNPTYFTDDGTDSGFLSTSLLQLSPSHIVRASLVPNAAVSSVTPAYFFGTTLDWGTTNLFNLTNAGTVVLTVDGTGRLRLAGGLTDLNPLAANGVTPYIADTGVAHTSGNLAELRNNGTAYFQVGYNGTLGVFDGVSYYPLYFNAGTGKLALRRPTISSDPSLDVSDIATTDGWVAYPNGYFQSQNTNGTVYASRWDTATTHSSGTVYEWGNNTTNIASLTFNGALSLSKTTNQLSMSSSQLLFNGSAVGSGSGTAGTVINTGTPAVGNVPQYSDTTGTNIVPSTANTIMWDGSQASRTWTANLSGTDPVWTYGSGVVNLSTGVLQLGTTAPSTAFLNFGTNAPSSLLFTSPSQSGASTNLGFNLVHSSTQFRTTAPHDEVLLLGYNISASGSRASTQDSAIALVLEGSYNPIGNTNQETEFQLRYTDPAGTDHRPIAWEIFKGTYLWYHDDRTARYEIFSPDPTNTVPYFYSSPSQYIYQFTDNAFKPGFQITANSSNTVQIASYGGAAVSSLTWSGWNQYSFNSMTIGTNGNITSSAIAATGGITATTSIAGTTGIGTGSGGTIWFSKDSAATMQFDFDSASPVSHTLKGADGAGTDKVGADITIAGGQGTGSGNRGRVMVKTASVGSTGSSANAYTTSVYVGGVLKSDTTTTGNIGGGTDNLITYTIPASQLAVNGDTIDFDCSGSFAATVNAKTLTGVYGGTTFVTTGSLVLNGLPWRCHGKIKRTGATTQNIFGEITVGGTLLSAVNTTVAFNTTAAETLSGTVVFKMTGSDDGGIPADNAVVQNNEDLRWMPNGN